MMVKSKLFDLRFPPYKTQGVITVKWGSSLQAKTNSPILAPPEGHRDDLCAVQVFRGCTQIFNFQSVLICVNPRQKGLDLELLLFFKNRLTQFNAYGIILNRDAG